MPGDRRAGCRHDDFLIVSRQRAAPVRRALAGLLQVLTPLLHPSLGLDLEERARVLVEQGVDLVGGLLRRGAHRDHPLSGTLPQTLRRLVEVPAHGTEPVDYGEGVLGLGQGHLGEEHGKLGLDPEDVADAPLGRPGLQDVCRGSGFEDEHFAGDPLVGGQRGGVDGLGCGGELPQCGDVGVLGFPTDLVEVVVVS